MPRLMSVAYTEDAVRERRKTVTRRTGWWKDRNGRQLIKPGDRLMLCRKLMGLRRGEKIERICEVEVVSVRREASTNWSGSPPAGSTPATCAAKCSAPSRRPTATAPARWNANIGVTWPGTIARDERGGLLLDRPFYFEPGDITDVQVHCEACDHWWKPRRPDGRRAWVSPSSTGATDV